MERLVGSAAELGFPVLPEPRVLLRALEGALAAERLGDAIARIVVTRGDTGPFPRPGHCVEVLPIEGRLWRGGRTGGARAIYAKEPFEPGTLMGHKTTSRLVYDQARGEAQAAGAEEALLVSPAGEVLEGAVTNVFAVFRDLIRTPPLASGILPGITRAWVIETCAGLGLALAEDTIRRDELMAADEIFLTNSVQGVVPVAELQGLRLPRRSLGDRLREAYHEAVSEAIEQAAR